MEVNNTGSFQTEAKLKDSFEISIHLEHPNTLKSLYPQVKHEHVSLTLSGEMGDDDFDFLRGDELKEEIFDEEIGEFYQLFINPYWDSIDLHLCNITIPRCFFIERNISAYGLSQLETSNVQIKCEGGGFIRCYYPSDRVMESVTSMLITKETQWLYKSMFDEFPNLKDYIIEEGSKFLLVDGVLFSEDKSTLVSMPPAMQLEDYEIPEGTTVIGSDAFRGCRYLKSVSVPKSVIRIETDAFEGCDNLEKFIVHPDNNYYYSKKDVLFEYIYAWHRSDYAETIKCLLRFPPTKKLKSGKVSIHYYTIQAIASHAFSGCKNITELNIHIIYKDNIDRLFYNIPNLKSLSVSCEKLPDIVGCDNLETLETYGVELIPYFYSHHVQTIKEYKIPSNRFHTVDGVVFSNYNELCLYPPKREDKVYVVPKGTTGIYESVFYYAYYLEEVIIPSDIYIMTASGERIPYKEYEKKEELFKTYYDRQIKIKIAD